MKIIDLLKRSDNSLRPGIFYYLWHVCYEEDCPYIEENNAGNLDIIYYTMHSGDKNTSITFNRILKDLMNNDIDNTLGFIARQCYIMYKHKWESLYTTMVETSYNALENYNKSKESLQQTNTNLENTEDIDSNTFGFDTVSTDGVPKDKSSKSGSIVGDAEDNYISRESSEHGNDGKFSKQELIQQEIEVKKHLFYEILFKDIDAILANRIYD